MNDSVDANDFNLTLKAITGNYTSDTISLLGTLN